MRVIDIVQGCRIYDASTTAQERVVFIADADIDNDGSDNHQHDRYWQPDTTLHHNGQPIDSNTVPGIVVPPCVIYDTRGIALGCRAVVTNLLTDESIESVVFDLGPFFKIGELSPAAARGISVNPDPVNGGESERIIRYQIFPGMAALVNGVQYKLQAYRRA